MNKNNEFASSFDSLNFGDRFQLSYHLPITDKVTGEETVKMFTPKYTCLGILPVSDTNKECMVHAQKDIASDGTTTDPRLIPVSEVKDRFHHTDLSEVYGVNGENVVKTIKLSEQK